MPIPVNLESFLQTLDKGHPPEGWPETLRALWYAGAGNWEASHALAQDIQGDTGSWIHAYLHRVEGDRWNAGYWYDRARRPFPTSTLNEEFETLVRFVLHLS